MSFRVAGKLPGGKHRQQLQQSPQFRNGAFQNISPTPMKPEGVSYWKMMRAFFRKHPDTAPPVRLPFVKTDLQQLDQKAAQVIWFGHSSYLLRLEGKTFLVDPVFSGNAAPVSFMVKSFPGSNEYKATDLPPIDYLILTHDHYDHLDFRTIRSLRNRVGSIYCSLGLSAHLRHWGVEKEKITEIDWWETVRLEETISLTAAPARHFSGRGLKRGQTLWSSFILQTKQHTIYIGGDSGYDTHFREIGERFGPFDLAILEAGQYNTMWPLIHMMPEETVQAAADLRAKKLLPVHWGKFRLGMHAWNEPIQRVLAKAKESGMTVLTPRIGEPVLLDGENQFTDWWTL